MGDVTAPCRYEIRVAGLVPPEVLLDFDQLRASVEPGVTVMYGPLADQAAMFGLLARLELFGVQVLELRRFRPDSSPLQECQLPGAGDRLAPRGGSQLPVERVRL